MEAVRKGTEFIFLYELVEGTVDFSFAVYVAKQIGLPESIITRADEVLALKRRFLSSFVH